LNILSSLVAAVVGMRAAAAVVGLADSVPAQVFL
jgi:hypothetical protein